MIIVNIFELLTTRGAATLPLDMSNNKELKISYTQI